ncbi:hypothetical protein HHX47_DHR8000234 [Lentinula edodes]|nr:hypothetical protein HHX47_DHR8000234 [Lentinula edodes]
MSSVSQTGIRRDMGITQVLRSPSAFQLRLIKQKIDFVNGWEDGVLQKAISGCNCNPYGDPSCCVDAGIFTFNQTRQCFISNTVDEPVLGNLSTLPGANPVQAPCFESYIATSTPVILAPVYTYVASASIQLPSGTLATSATVTLATQTAVGTCIWKGAGSLSRNVSTCLRIAAALESKTCKIRIAKYFSDPESLNTA